MTDRTELERQIAELQAQLAALPEVDPLLVEADNMASSHALWDTKHDYEEAKSLALAALRRGMELAPRAVMDAAAVEALARECADSISDTLRAGTWQHDIALRAAKFAIRETLSRVPAAAWSEYGKVHTDGSRSGGQPIAEPRWIDWHGGECPVPAGTRVEVRFASGATNTDDMPEEYTWRRDGLGCDIIAYRILGGAA